VFLGEGQRAERTFPRRGRAGSGKGEGEGLGWVREQRALGLRGARSSIIKRATRQAAKLSEPPSKAIKIGLPMSLGAPDGRQIDSRNGHATRQRHIEVGAWPTEAPDRGRRRRRRKPKKKVGTEAAGVIIFYYLDDTGNV
jgi:hypothetical protein